MAVLSIASFFCGARRPLTASRRETRKKTTAERLGGKKPTRLHSSISNKALLMAKMISWRKVQDHDGGEKDWDNIRDDDDDEEEDGDGAIWRRTIVKGEKCRPWDFSGKISYDSKGNLILDSDY